MSRVGDSAAAVAGRASGLGGSGPVRRPDAGCSGPVAAALASALALLVTLAGCQPASSPPVASPERIIAVAPSVTEILYVLGLGDRLVGVGDYATWPPEVRSKTRIGGLFDPRFEQIVALRPDLAILLPSEESLGVQLRELGIEVLTVPSESLDDIESAVGLIAERTGAGEAAAEFLRQWRRDLAPTALPGSPRVALTVARQRGALTEILVPGGETFLDELLERLGAVNVFGDSPVLYPQLGAEQWLERQPEAILELQPEELTPEEVGELKADWRALPDLEAARRGCVYIIQGSHTLLPGPRLPRLYREMREALSACLAEPA